VAAKLLITPEGCWKKGRGGIFFSRREGERNRHLSHVVEGSLKEEMGNSSISSSTWENREKGEEGTPGATAY